MKRNGIFALIILMVIALFASCAKKDKEEQSQSKNEQLTKDTVKGPLDGTWVYSEKIEGNNYIEYYTFKGDTYEFSNDGKKVLIKGSCKFIGFNTFVMKFEQINGKSFDLEDHLYTIAELSDKFGEEKINFLLGSSIEYFYEISDDELKLSSSGFGPRTYKKKK